MSYNTNKFITVHIKGYSMKPLINSNDTVIIKYLSDYKVGDIVAFRYETTDYILHRLLAITENQLYYCKGDNTFQIEIIKKKQILGKVIFIKKDDKIQSLPLVSDDFIMLSLAVNKEFIENNGDIKKTIKSNTYKKFIEERNNLCCL